MNLRLKLNCNYYFLTDGNREARELTDEMLVKLSQEINFKGELRALAISGLAMKSAQVETSLQNNSGDITSAVYGVLREWRATKCDAAEAYEELYKALNKCNLGHYIRTVLVSQ